MYAAVCGCIVHMFEIQPTSVTLIESSIKANSLSPFNIRVHNKLVSNFPKNTTFELEVDPNHETSQENTKVIPVVRLDDMSWISSIFVLKINLDDFEYDALRSAESLFQQRRILHLILYYDTVINGEDIKKELIYYLKNDLKPRYVYIFHPTVDKLYGPLSNRQLKNLPNQTGNQTSLVGLYAVFDSTLIKSSIAAESYDPATFFV